MDIHNNSASITSTTDATSPTNQASRIEHPLLTPWTFWCDKTVRGATAEQFKDSLTLIHCISSAEGFWRVFKNIPAIEDLAPGVTYHLMRDGREPMWEDKANCNGGTWRFRVKKQDSPRVWLEMLLAAIGEQFDGVLAPTDTVVGVSISIRERDDLLQIWNNDSQLAEQASADLLEKVDKLLVERPVSFLASFYKPNQTHQAYEGTRTMAGSRKPS